MQLESLRLTHHKMTEAERDNYVRLVTNQDVMAFITGHALDVETANIRFEKVLRVNEEFADLGVFSVYEKGINAYAGLSKLTHLRDGVAEVGYALLPPFWGRGYATEITHSMIEMARTLPRLTLLEAFIDPPNKASRRVLEKCSFTYVGEQMRNNLLSGVFQLEI